MNKFIGWFTRKRMFVVCFLFVAVYVFSYFNSVLDLSDVYRSFCCADDRKLNLFLIFIPVFIFALISFSLNDSNFRSWKKFSFTYLLTYLIIYFLVPTSGDGFIWFQRETLSFYGSILYLVTSLILIIYKSLKKE